MTLNSRNSFRDTRVAAEFAEIIDAEAAVNEEFDRETDVYVPISERKETQGTAETKVVETTTHVYERTAEDRELFRCQGCNVDTLEIDEYYMVQFHIWKSAVPVKFQDHVLCIGCLEGYLGRELVSEDFIEAPVNYFPSKSERLMNRWGQWFRDFDGPYETPEEMHADAEELGKRFDGLVTRNG